jgi:hypothetical protein
MTTLAYLASSSATKEKSFITLPPGLLGDVREPRPRRRNFRALFHPRRRLRTGLRVRPAGFAGRPGGFASGRRKILLETCRKRPDTPDVRRHLRGQPKFPILEVKHVRNLLGT